MFRGDLVRKSPYKHNIREECIIILYQTACKQNQKRDLNFTCRKLHVTLTFCMSGFLNSKYLNICMAVAQVNQLRGEVAFPEVEFTKSEFTFI